MDIKLNNGFKVQYGGIVWSNKTSVSVYFPVSFTGWYAAVATDVGTARLVYAADPVSVSYFNLLSVNAANIGAKWLAIGF